MRAQVTVFIIIGLVLIMGIGAYFTVQNRQHAEELQIQGQINSLELLPVQEYINKVAEDLLVEGIFLISRQGGRIYDSTWPECQEEDPSYEEQDRECLQMGQYSYAPKTYVDNAPYDHRRVAVLIDDGRDGDDDQWTMTVKTDSGSYFPMPQEQAYLHYQSAVGTTYGYGFFEPMPPISGEKSVEQQLERWIENHLGKALNYTVLQESGYDIGPLSNVKASVDVNLEDVTANISYTVTIDREEIRYEPQHTFMILSRRI